MHISCVLDMNCLIVTTSWSRYYYYDSCSTQINTLKPKKSSKQTEKQDFELRLLQFQELILHTWLTLEVRFYCFYPLSKGSTGFEVKNILCPGHSIKIACICLIKSNMRFFSLWFSTFSQNCMKKKRAVNEEF